jgi:hypothetical protein
VLEGVATAEVPQGVLEAVATVGAKKEICSLLVAATVATIVIARTVAESGERTKGALFGSLVELRTTVFCEQPKYRRER